MQQLLQGNLSIKIYLPRATLPKPDALYFRPPTAGIPSYKPIVIPPSDLEAPPDVKEETTEEVVQPSLKIPVIDIQMPIPETAVVVTAVTTAVVAVATTSITSSLFEGNTQHKQNYITTVMVNVFLMLILMEI